MERLISKGSDIGIALRLANEGLAPAISDLQAITDDELYLVSRVAYATRTPRDPAVKNSIDLEIARRSVTVTERSVHAIVASTVAIVQLRAATERWSTWLTRLTIGIFFLTAVIVVLALAQRYG